MATRNKGGQIINSLEHISKDQTIINEKIISRIKSSYLVKLSSHLNRLDDAANSHSKGGSAFAKLGTENALSFCRILFFQCINDYVEAF